MKYLVKFTAWLLKKDLSLKNRSILLSAVLKSSGVLPIYNIITSNDQGSLFINGNQVDMDKAIQLRESARGALNNQARKLVKEQVRYLAVTQGIHNANTFEQLFFSKAAIWLENEENKILEALAQLDG
jgi:hypothetical protein